MRSRYNQFFIGVCSGCGRTKMVYALTMVETLSTGALLQFTRQVCPACVPYKEGKVERRVL